MSEQPERGFEALTVYEPRWHGFAKWKAEEYEHRPYGFLVRPIVSGWVRREPGSEVRRREYVQARLSRKALKREARRLA
jgi:hypothetical protein